MGRGYTDRIRILVKYYNIYLEMSSEILITSSAG